MSDVFELAAVCDVDADKARAVGAENGVRAYSRVQDLAANEDLDIAAISTPGDSHHAIGAYLAERGVNLIVETPISPTLQTADVLIRAVERGGVKLEVAEQFCREPMYLMKRRAIEAGAIGDVLRVFSLFQTGGYHIVSNVRAMACDSEAVRVTGLTMNSPIPRVNISEIRQYEAENWTMDLVEFENGALAVMSYSSMYHGRALGRKSKTLFQVDGTTGTIVEDDVHTNHGSAAIEWRPCQRLPDQDGDARDGRDAGAGPDGGGDGPAAGVGESVAPVPHVSARAGDRGRDGQYRQCGSGRPADAI